MFCIVTFNPPSSFKTSKIRQVFAVRPSSSYHCFKPLEQILSPQYSVHVLFKNRGMKALVLRLSFIVTSAASALTAGYPGMSHCRHKVPYRSLYNKLQTVIYTSASSSFYTHVAELPFPSISYDSTSRRRPSTTSKDLENGSPSTVTESRFPLTPSPPPASTHALATFSS